MVKDFRLIFGRQLEQGKIIFFDAYPKTPPKLKIDVINPHYSDYYAGKKNKKGDVIPPADYHNPKPIYFLTLEDTKFEFFIGGKSGKKGINNVTLDKVSKLLGDALQNYGIGAKTAVGYGYMSVCP